MKIISSELSFLRQPQQNVTKILFTKILISRFDSKDRTLIFPYINQVPQS